MEDKLYSDLTENEKEEVLSNNRVKELKNAQNDMKCGNCGGSIKQGNAIYVSSFMSIDCCSIDCCDDVFRSGMD